MCSTLGKHSSRCREESGSRCGHSTVVAPGLGLEGPCRQVQGLEQEGQRGSGVATGLNSDLKILFCRIVSMLWCDENGRRWFGRLLSGPFMLTSLFLFRIAGHTSPH